MSGSAFRQIAPGRLQVREGGGCMAIFGLPFLGTGVFALLFAAGLITLQNADTVSMTFPASIGIGITFTLVGGALVFGRTWTTLSQADRTISRQRGLLVPMVTNTHRVDEYESVVLEFIPGDSDSADQYPVILRARSGPNLRLFSSTQYAESRTRAIAVANLFHFDIEDGTTKRRARMSPAQADMSFQHRHRLEHQRDELAARPASMRSEVSDRDGNVTIVIPSRRWHPALYLFFLIPIMVPVLLFDPLSRFFRQTRTPDVVSVVFLGFLVVAFGVLPAYSALSAFLKSRRGQTIITASPAGVRIEERRIWKTRTRGWLPAADILDIEGIATSPAAGPAIEPLLKTLHKLGIGGGVTIKTRDGLTTFAEGLDDGEVRYLHDMVRKALVRGSLG